jgi:hypothetical protein
MKKPVSHSDSKSVLVLYDPNKPKSTIDKVDSIVSGTWRNFRLSEVGGGVIVSFPSHRDAVSAKRPLLESGMFVLVKFIETVNTHV